MGGKATLLEAGPLLIITLACAGTPTRTRSSRAPPPRPPVDTRTGALSACAAHDPTLPPAALAAPLVPRVRARVRGRKRALGPRSAATIAAMVWGPQAVRAALRTA